MWRGEGEEEGGWSGGIIRGRLKKFSRPREGEYWYKTFYPNFSTSTLYFRPRDRKTVSWTLRGGGIFSTRLHYLHVSNNFLQLMHNLKLPGA